MSEIRDNSREIIPEKIAQIAARAKSPAELAYDLRNQAYSCQSPENISVVVVDLERRIHSLFNRIVE